MAFMKQRGITRVLSLLAMDEEDLYAYPGYQQLLTQEGGLVLQTANLDADCAASAMSFLKEAEEAQEKVVVVCTTGIDDTGCMLAAWLVHRYELEVDAACEEVVKSARPSKRSPTAAKVNAFLGKGG